MSTPFRSYHAAMRAGVSGSAFGPEWLQGIDWKMPNALMANVPGFEKVATALMKKTVVNKGVASIEELRSLCMEAEVKMVACQMTVDLFEFSTSSFIDGIELGGAALFFEFAGDADISLFM